MKAIITSVLPASADRVWALVRQSRTLVFITRGLLRFAGADRFPAEWHQGAAVQTRLFFWSAARLASAGLFIGVLQWFQLCASRIKVG